jgi:D-glycero-beta-D-manno-heptose-7-phosphate kinase
MNRTDDIISRLSQPRIMVIGDVVLDEYLYGTATRLSREAPIPVLEFVRRASIPGAAANPAHNIAALGARAVLAGVVGDDQEGRQLLDLLRENKVDPACILVDPSRPTTVKTRIVSQGSLRFPQQIARIDRISREPVSSEILSRMEMMINQRAGTIDAVLCSDYLSGLLSPELVQALARICREHQLLLSVDAQGELEKYRGAGLLRCNNHEAATFLRRRLRSDDEYAAGLSELLDGLEAQLVVVTRGADGVSMMGRHLPYIHLPARTVEVADVTGAGDTFIAVITLGLAAGLPAVEAARLANTAASLVVRRIGNAVVSPDELRDTIRAEGSRP